MHRCPHWSAASRSFFRYAEAQGWCATGIAAVIESPRLYAREGLPEGPGWEDVQRLLASTRGDRRADIRDHAILMLLAVYGFRRGEVAGLRLDDLDWAGGYWFRAASSVAPSVIPCCPRSGKRSCATCAKYGHGASIGRCF